MAFGTFTELSNYHNSGLWKFRIFTWPQKENLYSLTVTLLSPVPQLLVHTCCCSISQLCLTLCDPINCSTPDSLSITISLSLLRLMSIESVMSSNHLILCCPLSPPALNLSQHQDLFQWVGSSHQMAKVFGSFSFSISHWKDWCWHTLVCFFSMDLPTLDISYKWNHMICMIVCIWLLSPSIMFSRLNSVLACVSISFLFMLCCFSRVRLCDPMDYNLPGSSVHGILQARTLEWVAISSSNFRLWLHNILLHGHKTFCLFVYQMMDICFFPLFFKMKIVILNFQVQILVWSCFHFSWIYIYEWDYRVMCSIIIL